LLLESSVLLASGLACAAGRPLRPSTTAGVGFKALCTTATNFRVMRLQSRRGEPPPADQQHAFLGVWASQNSCQAPGNHLLAQPGVPSRAFGLPASSPVAGGATFQAQHLHHFTRTRPAAKQAAGPGSPQKRAKPSPEPADPPGTAPRGPITRAPAHGLLCKRATAMASDALLATCRPQPLVGGGLHPHLLRATPRPRRWRPSIAFECGA